MAQWGLSLLDSMPHTIQEFGQANTLTPSWFIPGFVMAGFTCCMRVEFPLQQEAISVSHQRV